MVMDFGRLRLRATPNQYLVAPAGLCEADTPHRVLPYFPYPAGHLKDRFLALIRRQPRVRELDRDEGNMAYEFVQRTRLLGFPDRISVQFFDRGSRRSGLAIYSRSKYGYSDLGANKARIDEWLDLLDRELEG